MVAGVVWLGVMVAGFAVLKNEQFTPARQMAVAGNFPEGSSLPLAKEGRTLVMFAHPGCPCTRASFHELETILANAGSGVSPVIVFMSSGEEGNGRGDLWRTALEFPRAKLVLDATGEEARRFGVTASGHALLFEADGTLLFSGGITLSRGHEGVNPGESAIASLLASGTSRIKQTPVFGCNLVNE